MEAGLELRVSAIILATVAVCVAAYQAASVFTPLVLALFIIAVVWPMHGSRTRMLSTEASEHRPASYKFVAE